MDDVWPIVAAILVGVLIAAIAAFQPWRFIF